VLKQVARFSQPFLTFRVRENWRAHPLTVRIFFGNPEARHIFQHEVPTAWLTNGQIKAVADKYVLPRKG